MAQTEIRMDQVNGQMEALDQDIVFKVNDGGVSTEVLRFHGDTAEMDVPQQPASWQGTAAPNQSLSAGTFTTVNLDSQQFINNISWSTGNDEFTIGEAGYYQVNAHVTFVAGGAQIVVISVNGDTNSRRRWRQYAGSYATGSMSLVIKLNAGDTVEVKAYASSATTIYNYSSGLSLIKIA